MIVSPANVYFITGLTNPIINMGREEITFTLHSLSVVSCYKVGFPKVGDTSLWGYWHASCGQ